MESKELDGNLNFKLQFDRAEVSSGGPLRVRCATAETAIARFKELIKNSFEYTHH